jgi:hypothetical protein
MQNIAFTLLKVNEQEKVSEVCGYRRPEFAQAAMRVKGAFTASRT